MQLGTTSGATPQDITVTFTDSGLTAGTHTATITLASPDVPGESVSIRVEVIIEKRIYLPLVGG